MERRLNIASWILVGLLLLPLLQHATGLVKERKLKGAVTQADVPRFKGENWWNMSYQDSLETAMNDRFGFRNLFIRINNQVAFSFYRKALASGVVIGKDNYMYERNYIKAYNGEDFVGDSVIRQNSETLKVLQDTLESRGKNFVVAFAAGKGSFYPEYFPDRYQMQPGRTNLAAYKDWFDRCGVNYIDFNAWFLQMKDTSRYILYPRTGVHWSYYGMVLVIDSLVNYLEKTSGHEMPVFNYYDIRESRKYRSSDKDIEDGMNIIFRVNRDKLAYPKVQFIDENVNKLKGVVIADSFYWGLHNIGFSSRIFDKGEYWYYNKRIIANHLDGPLELDTIDRWQRLENVDVVMMMATGATLPKFPFGIESIFDSASISEE